jgi:hypothetical protein
LVLAPKTDAISLATLGFRQYRPSFFPVDLQGNLEVGMEMKSLGVMNEGAFCCEAKYVRT